MRKRLHMLWIPLILLIVVSAAAAVLFYLSGSYIAAAAAVLVFLCDAVLCAMTVIIDRNITRYVTGMDRDILKTGREEFYDYPEPILITDPDRSIIWYNRSFEKKIFGEDRVYGIKLSELVGNNLSKIYAEGGASVKILDRYYRVSADETADGLSIVSFVDISGHVALEQEYKASRKIVMIIAVDNYEEVLQNSKESDKASFRVQIEKMF